MSDWWDCPTNRLVMSFASGNILTGLDEFGQDLGLTAEQESEIDRLRRDYRQQHLGIATAVHERTQEIRQVLRQDELSDENHDSLLALVDQHTSLLNDLERLWVRSIFQAFTILDGIQVAKVRGLVDERMSPFGGSNIIGAI